MKMWLGMNIEWILVVLVPVLVHIQAKRSLVYDIPGLHCGEAWIREIDGILLRSSTSQLYSNYLCLMRFQADDDYSTSKTFMINVKRLNITTCNVSLKFYYSSTIHFEREPADMTYDCHTSLGTMQQVIFTPRKYLTIRFDKKSAVGYDFEIIVTTVKPREYCRGEFLCANRFCIDRDLVCDGIDHCSDQSDETCQRNSYVIPGRRMHNSMGLMVGMLLTSSAGLILCCLLTVACCRRHRATTGRILQRYRPEQQIVCVPLNPTASTNPPPSYNTTGVYPATQASSGYPVTSPAYPPQNYPPQNYPPQNYPPPSQPYPQPPPQYPPPPPYPQADQYYPPPTQ